MNLPDSISVKTLGQITLMQSVVYKLPDQESMLEFVCRGFKDIQGVEAVRYRLAEDHLQALKETLPKDGAFRVFAIHNTQTPYAELVFSLSDPDQFDPYIPFVENFCNMLGVIFDEQHQRALNESLRAELEKRVSDRTKALEQEVREHKQTAHDLAQSEIRFREFVENTDSLVTRVDGNGDFIYVNHSAMEIFGLAPEDCIGLSAFSFVAPKDQDRTREWFKECLEQRIERATIENSLVTPSGQRRDLIWNVSFNYDPDGNLDYANSIAKDISQRRLLEARLRQAQKMRPLERLPAALPMTSTISSSR